MANKPVKKDNSKMKIILLIVIMVAFGFVFVFVTLPSFGVDIFPKSTPQSTNQNVNQTSVQQALTINIKAVDTARLTKAMQDYQDEATNLSLYPDIFVPFVVELEKRQDLEEMILVDSSQVTEYPNVSFLGYIRDENKDKWAWLKFREEPNKIHLLKLNSHLPGMTDIQIIEINEVGLLLYKYPKLDGNETAPQLFRIIASPFAQIKSSNLFIKTE